MVLNRLRHLHTPTAPAILTLRQWKAIEEQLGIALPEDYKALLGVYAEGPHFGEWYGFYNFLAEHGRAAARKDLTHLRRVRDEVQGELLHVAGIMGRPANSVRSPVPFPVFPEPGGLFPWGWAQDGWTFYWLCDSTNRAGDVVAGFKWVEEYYRLPGKTAAQLLLEMEELLPTTSLESLLRGACGPN